MKSFEDAEKEIEIENLKQEARGILIRFRFGELPRKQAKAEYERIRKILEE